MPLVQSTLLRHLTSSRAPAAEVNSDPGMDIDPPPNVDEAEGTDCSPEVFAKNDTDRVRMTDTQRDFMRRVVASLPLVDFTDPDEWTAFKSGKGKKWAILHSHSDLGWSIHHSKDRLKSKDVYKAAGVDRSLRTAKERKDDIALNPRFKKGWARHPIKASSRELRRGKTATRMSPTACDLTARLYARAVVVGLDLQASGRHGLLFNKDGTATLLTPSGLKLWKIVQDEFQAHWPIIAQNPPGTMALKWSNGKDKEKLHADAAKYIKGKINEFLLTEDEIAAGKTEKESKFLFCYKA